MGSGRAGQGASEAKSAMLGGWGLSSLEGGRTEVPGRDSGLSASELHPLESGVEKGEGPERSGNLGESGAARVLTLPGGVPSSADGHGARGVRDPQPGAPHRGQLCGGPAAAGSYHGHTVQGACFRTHLTPPAFDPTLYRIRKSAPWPQVLILLSHCM